MSTTATQVQEAVGNREIAGFIPKGRTFTEAFLDDETIPWGSSFTVGDTVYTKCVILGVSGPCVLASYSDKVHPWAYWSPYHKQWVHVCDVGFDPPTAMESDITEITPPPESK